MQPATIGSFTSEGEAQSRPVYRMLLGIKVSPFLKTNIAMALVPAEVAASGSDVLVQCRANQVRAKQVPVPFYKRVKK